MGNVSGTNTQNQTTTGIPQNTLLDLLRLGGGSNLTGQIDTGGLFGVLSNALGGGNPAPSPITDTGLYGGVDLTDPYFNPTPSGGYLGNYTYT
jgi:hypothetical protein